jgi:hypothetical protein
LAALGRNGQVIVDVIPTVALITGPQTAVPDLPPAEAENRFTLAFQNFMRVFAQADHPGLIVQGHPLGVDHEEEEGIAANVDDGAAVIDSRRRHGA